MMTIILVNPQNKKTSSFLYIKNLFKERTIVEVKLVTY